MLRLLPLALIALIALLACGDDDGGTDAAVDSAIDSAIDAGSDAGSDAGFDAGSDAGSDAGADAGDDAGLDAGDRDSGSDAGADAGSDAGFDAGSDAGGDASVPDPGPVDCRMDSDCSGPAADCNASAPGGICTGCAPGTCGALECRVGACVRTCSGDGDCNAGKRCGATGICLLRNCGPSTPCPDPYVCSTGRCQRPTCAAGCPTGWSCEGTYCVEP